jgi:hypothetical protein
MYAGLSTPQGAPSFAARPRPGDFFAPGSQIPSVRPASVMGLALTLGLALAGCRSTRSPVAERSPTLAETAPRWPESVAEAVQLKMRTMSEGEKGAIRAASRDRVQDQYHGFQMQHRADFGLSEGNHALLLSCGSLTMAAEECMRIILDALWVALQPPPQLEHPVGR